MKYVLALTATLALFSQQSLAAISVASSSRGSVAARPRTAPAAMGIPKSMTIARGTAAGPKPGSNFAPALKPLTRSPLQLRLLQAQQMIKNNPKLVGAGVAGAIGVGALATAVGLAADSKHDVQKLEDEVEAQGEQKVETITPETNDFATEADEAIEDSGETSTEADDADKDGDKDYSETSEDYEKITDDDPFNIE